MSVDDSEGKLVIDDLNIDSDPVSINNAHRVERVENFDEIVNEGLDYTLYYNQKLKFFNFADMDIMDKTSEEKIGYDKGSRRQIFFHLAFVGPS
jgi:hypothetical protein